MINITPLPKRLKPSELNRFHWEWLHLLPDDDPVCASIKKQNTVPGLPTMVLSWADDSFAIVRGVPSAAYLDQAALELCYQIGRAQLERLHREEVEAVS